MKIEKIASKLIDAGFYPAELSIVIARKILRANAVRLIGRRRLFTEPSRNKK